MGLAFAGSRFGALLLLSEAAFIILFGCFVDYGWDGTPVSIRGRQFGGNPTEMVADRQVSKTDVIEIHSGSQSADLLTPRISIEKYYAMFQDVHVMIFVGFGFLVAFMRNYGYSGVGFTFILAAFVLQWATIMRGFWVMPENDYRIRLDITTLLGADFTAATILITFGVILGKLNRVQYLVVILFEVVFCTLNEWICIDIYSANDVGGTLTLHLFGAYFGLALARTMHMKEFSDSKFNALKYGTRNNDLLAMVGTFFLWLFWPSFNAAIAEEDGRYRAIYNTYFSISASCIGAFFVSSFTSNKRFRMDVIQNATLAGGVIIGSAADMYIYPWGALIVGFSAGIISAVGFHFLMPFLEEKLGIHDTCGVHNLHAMPSFFGTIISAIVIACATPEVYGSSFYRTFPTVVPPSNTTAFQILRTTHPDLKPGLGRSIGQQAGYQMAAMATTLGIALAGGIFTGLLLRWKWWRGLSAGSTYNDSHHWELPEKLTREEERELRHQLDKKAYPYADSNNNSIFGTLEKATSTAELSLSAQNLRKIVIPIE